MRWSWPQQTLHPTRCSPISSGSAFAGMVAERRAASGAEPIVAPLEYWRHETGSVAAECGWHRGSACAFWPLGRHNKIWFGVSGFLAKASAILRRSARAGRGTVRWQSRDGKRPVRMLLGFVVAALVGCQCRPVDWSIPTGESYIEPSLEFLRPLPASAVIPVAILLLGLTKTMIISVIVLDRYGRHCWRQFRALSRWSRGLFRDGPYHGASSLDGHLGRHIAQCLARYLCRPEARTDGVIDPRGGHRNDVSASGGWGANDPPRGAIVPQSGVVCRGSYPWARIGFGINAVMEFTQRHLLRWRH